MSYDKDRLDGLFGPPPETLDEKLDRLERQIEWIDDKLEAIKSSLSQISIGIAIIFLYQIGLVQRVLDYFK